MIVSTHTEHHLANRIFHILRFFFSDQSLLKVTYQDNELIIQIETDLILKNEFKALIQEEFTGL